MKTQKEKELLETLRKWEDLCHEGLADTAYWKAQAKESLAALRWSWGIVNDYWHAQTTEERNHFAADMQHALDTMHKAIKKAEGNA